MNKAIWEYPEDHPINIEISRHIELESLRGTIQGLQNTIKKMGSNLRRPSARS